MILWLYYATLAPDPFKIDVKSSSLENQDAAGTVDGAGDGGGIVALRYERSHSPTS